ALRITPNNPEDGPYLLAWLNSSIGQSLIRRNITGSVIDHVDIPDIASLPVPLVEGPVAKSVRALMAASIKAPTLSRLNLDSMKLDLSYNLPPLSRIDPSSGWTRSAAALSERLDAAAYSPTASQAAAILREAGGVTLGSVAEVAKPAS